MADIKSTSQSVCAEEVISALDTLGKKAVAFYWYAPGGVSPLAAMYKVERNGNPEVLRPLQWAEERYRKHYTHGFVRGFDGYAYKDANGEYTQGYLDGWDISLLLADLDMINDAFPS